MNHDAFDRTGDSLAAQFSQMSRSERFIEAALRKIESGEMDGAKGLSTHLSGLMKARVSLIAERGRLRDDELKRRDRITQHDIDFDTRRSKIAGRLAKLRRCCRARRTTDLPRRFVGPYSK